MFPPSPARRRFLGIKPGRPAAVEVGPDQSSMQQGNDIERVGRGGAGGCRASASRNA